MDADGFIARVEAALNDADATLSTDLGGQREVTTARAWHGQVLVDWEPDERAGDCLLRPDLLRQLLVLRASARVTTDELVVVAPGRAVAALSPRHAALVQRLGGARRIELTVQLKFADGVYRGGEERYSLVGRRDRAPLFRLTADVRVRPTPVASPHRSLSGT